jgi:uncharacterized protein
METIWLGLTIGFAGSLHCIGMCGPLMTAMHLGGSLPPRRAIVYHIGRTIGYGILGLFMGLLGYSLRFALTQQWIALVIGVTLMLGWLIPIKKNLPIPWITSRIHLWRQKGMRLWKTNRWDITIGAGILHAWLPCGLVYTALATSVLMPSTTATIVFMMLFGLANTPALWFSGSLMHFLRKTLGQKRQRHIQWTLMALALLLMLRGAGLGIPYISPQLGFSHHNCCHP